MLDVKSSVDPKVSLMHWLAAEAEKMDNGIIDLSQDFPHLEAATRGTFFGLVCFMKIRSV